MTELEFEIALITNITEKKLGLTAGTLNVQKKTEQLVLGRMVICNLLMSGGITPAKLAEHFCKHRTAYYHYKKQHTSYMANPRMYPKYNLLYEAVADEYEQRAVTTDRFRNRLAKLEVIEDIENTLLTLQQQKEILLQTI